MATWLLEPEFERYEETKERKLVFAAHDPSARNHVLALCDACDGLGPCSYVDLSFATSRTRTGTRASSTAGPFDGLVVGCSSNGREFELIATAKLEHRNAKTIMLAELGLGRPGVPRLAGLAEASAPDLILVTNERAEASVAARLDAVGAKKTRVVLGGSGHLEKLRSSRTAELDRDAVRAAYNCARDAALVAYFACCDDAAFESPRTTSRRCACARDAALSYGSTTGLEAAALGVPTAFVVGGWAGQRAYLDDQYAHCDGAYPRLSTAADGAAFLAQARRAGGRRAPAADADHATGALERCRAALATVLAAKPGPYGGLNFKVVV
ncbi:hypothetical protein JL722_9578 [Aureococcus anophagefferens]|nr:hypothetical protein JL722_9578 [Aureococcus anophagefferens]